MKKFIGVFMLILGLGAYAEGTKLDVGIRANLVKPLVASADGNFGGQIFSTDNEVKSVVNVTINGNGNETVEVRVIKEMDLDNMDGEGTLKYGFDFEGSVESPEGSLVYKVGILQLDGTGNGALAITGRTIKAGEDYKAGNYEDTVTVDIKYI